jgi:hypothetical protein
MDLFNEWVERLGLQNWRIKLKVNQAEDEIPSDHAVAGHVQFIEEIRCAVIYIVSEAEYPDDSVLNYDFERILVHELLHIKFALFDNTRWNDETNMPDRHLHQLIDDMARALVCAKRGTLKIDIKEAD